MIRHFLVLEDPLRRDLGLSSVRHGSIPDQFQILDLVRRCDDLTNYFDFGLGAASR